ncbi:DUF1835 domain-containing protein [Paenibacillus lautus]|uniref:DUF1835 domain-containing protein n=1 Tax=Paenibacillus lautus TaxID=1401 RepID=UPI002DBC5381|nr:DUF1835 domain-containing protein [Paenibacillus lautus]MEC0311094.1 DUF1835 domain-containing protein [Paenibacillus lautus]
MGGIVIDKLFEKLSGYGEREHWLLLRQLVNTAIHDSTHGEHEDRMFGQRLYHLMEMHIDTVSYQRLQEEKLQTHVHIVFSLSEAGSLKVALSKVGKREESRVVAFNDWFSVGPITELSTKEGQLRRQMWLMEHDRDSYYSDSINQEHQIERMIDTLKNIPESKTVVIWCGDNAHDQTGLRFAMYLLRERTSPVHMVNVTQILTETAQGNAPVSQALVERDKYIEIVRNYGEGIPLNSDLRKRYESEWLELAGQEDVLRLWEEGTIIGCQEDKLDEVIVKSVMELQDKLNPGNFVKAGDVVTKILESSQQRISYSFIIYRIWSLVSDGVLTFKGLPGFPHQFSLGLSHV